MIEHGTFEFTDMSEEMVNMYINIKIIFTLFFKDNN